MGINQKTAKIPFWILFSIASFIVVFDFIFTYIILSTNSRAYESNPIQMFFVDTFGLDYFLVMVPISIIFLYLVIHLGDWLIKSFDKKTKINGKNYISIIIILITLPNVIINEILVLILNDNIFNLGFRGSIIAGLVLMIIYIILVELDDISEKKKNK